MEIHIDITDAILPVLEFQDSTYISMVGIPILVR